MPAGYRYISGGSSLQKLFYLWLNSFLSPLSLLQSSFGPFFIPLFEVCLFDLLGCDFYFTFFSTTPNAANKLLPNS